MKEMTDRLNDNELLLAIKQIVFNTEYGPSREDDLICNLRKMSIGTEGESEQSSEDQLFVDTEESIMMRDKHSHLTYSQKLWLYYRNKEHGEDLSTVWQKYGVSTSTMKNIIKNFESNKKRSELYTNVRCRKMIYSPAVSKSIAEFVGETVHWFTSKDVQQHIRKNLRILIPPHQIRDHLKNINRLSYKKGSKRPFTLDSKRLKLLKLLFALKFSKILPHLMLIINVDESTISNGTTKNYSWLKRGEPCTINNIKFKNFINVISAITTDGQWINMFKYQSTNQKNFIAFLEYLINLVTKDSGIPISSIGILMDNWSVHRAMNVRNYLRKQGVIAIYIPPYCPELAPVETYFSFLKGRLIQNSESEMIDLKKDEAITKIWECVCEVQRDYIKKLWSWFFKTVTTKMETLNSEIAA